MALWFTIADCIASKILTGKTPRVLKAVSFEPGAQQEGLTPIRIAGDSDYEVDPATDDFYRRLIDLRSSIKTKMKSAGPDEREELHALQLALKILANATSYGIFVELIVEEANRRVRCSKSRTSTMASAQRTLNPSTATRSPPSAMRCSTSAPMASRSCARRRRMGLVTSGRRMTRTRRQRQFRHR
jgi:hypothetical protein